MKPIGKHSLLGASGEVSDFQELLRYLDELILYDNMWDDGNSLGPKEVHNYLTCVMYNRRNKFNPLWNSLILGGVKKGQKYLGMLLVIFFYPYPGYMIGVNFEDNHVAIGFGNHLARPILRDEWHENLTFEEGVKLLEKCMRVLLYRDRSAVNKLQILCGYEHHMILNTTFVSEEVLKEGRVRVVARFRIRLSFDPLGLGAADCGRSSSSIYSVEGWWMEAVVGLTVVEAMASEWGSQKKAKRERKKQWGVRFLGLGFEKERESSYGSTLRYKSVERMKPIGKHSLLGASGEISDFQELLRYLDELILYDNMWDDGNSLGPKEVHNYLTRVMYNRRNKFNPLWNSLVLGGVKKGQKYLGMVSMIGVNVEDNHVATGFGNHLARPILRDEWHENLTFEEGVKLLEKCMRVLLYRDRSAVNKLQISKITEEGVTISQPYSLKIFWGFSAFENPTLGAEGSW
ncbi:unnamed protein product [Prunus brigantina]